MPSSYHLLSDPRFLEHDVGAWHPECPARLAAILTNLERSGLDRQAAPTAARRARLEELRRVHSEAHVEYVLGLRGRVAEIDPDTGTSQGSVRAAELAAGGGIDLVEAVVSSGDPGLALARPPGHHATPDRAMGFCLWNNVAAAAAHALDVLGLERVLVVDWDVHHGNGTQDIFYSDGRVMYFSVHQHPHFPGTGRVSELGAGSGVGTTINVPLPAGTRDQDVLGVFRRLLRPAAEVFEPSLLLVSAGFDGHRDDPLADWHLTADGYAQLAAEAADLARDLCAGRWAAFLEGGYCLEALAESTLSLVRVMAGEAPERWEDAPLQPRCRDTVERLQRVLGEIGVL